jgi:hypothetical protein
MWTFVVLCWNTLRAILGRLSDDIFISSPLFLAIACLYDRASYLFYATLECKLSCVAGAILHVEMSGLFPFGVLRILRSIGGVMYLTHGGIRVCYNGETRVCIAGRCCLLRCGRIVGVGDIRLRNSFRHGKIC